MDYKDYYKILGVEKTASGDEIKKKYRRLARKYHPDVSSEENAEEKFKEVKEAYEVLKDAEKRKAYDQLGSGWQGGQDGFETPPGWEFHQQGQGQPQGGFQGGGDFSDFFESIFGGMGGAQHARGRGRNFQQRGEDKHSKITISLEQAFHGAEIVLTLQDAVVNQQTGQVERKNRDLKVRIPKGINNGQQIRLAAQGGPGHGGAANGDLFLEISIKPDKLYKLDGNNITLRLPVTPWEAALGANIEVPTLAGNVNLKIPAGSQTGQKLRLKGRGLPAKKPGDQFIILDIYIPEPKNDEQKSLYEKMSQEMQFNPRKDLMGAQ
jgi:curved DNA-binding protein